MTSRKTGLQIADDFFRATGQPVPADVIFDLLMLDYELTAQENAASDPFGPV